MRIISGIYRGRKLTPPPKSWDLRPTLDRVKENLFNILQLRTEGARVLDLFAGTGSLGFEALSRGAENVVFNESNRDAVRLLNENIAALKAPQETWRIVSYDFLTALRALKNEKFDIILLDPPYGKDLAGQAVEKISEYGMLAAGGVIVIEEAAKKDLKLAEKNIIVKDEKNTCPPGRPGIIIRQRRDYGSVALYFLEEAPL